MRLLLAVTLFSAVTFAQTEQGVPDRIIDEEEARRDKKGSVAGRVLSVPFYPFRIVATGMEKGLGFAENRGWHRSMAGLAPGVDDRKQGFQPIFGGFDIGSGWAGGVKYFRKDFPVSGLTFEIPVRVSTNRYRELGVNFVAGAGRRVEFNFGGAYRGRPQDDFFGIGNSSLELGRSNFDLQERAAYVRPVFRITNTLSVVGQAEISSTSVFHGADNTLPDTREFFNGTQVPGLRGGSMFGGGLGLLHDSRETTGFPWHGGSEFAGASWHTGLGGFRYDYWKYRVEAMRFFPLFSQRRVLALRFYGESNIPRGNGVVPFFDMPVLGGGPTMRGFREFRFYDQTAALLTAEYRFRLNGWSSAFLFVDEGQVARRPGDIRWTAMRTSAGFGIRLFTTKSAVLTASFGRSAEGNRFYIVFAPRF